MVRLIEKAAEAYSKCRFVVTTRPQGKAAIAGFDEVTIDPLEPDAIAGFLDHWCRVLTFESEDRRAKHHGELLEALRSRPEIRRMAKNPVMLTALAVVHWNETRIPEQRADLYESVLKWLARSRKERPERPSPDRCLELLQVLALAMQDQPAGRVVQVDRGWGADVLTSELGSKPAALKFLEEEEGDSGIIVSRGAETRFWHLTFQEHLAARQIAGLTDVEQQKLLFAGGKLYRPEWREAMLLLAGQLLVKQGRGKVDGLLKAVLDRLGNRPALADQARCAGLIGAVLRDLEPKQYEFKDERYRASATRGARRV